MRDTAAIRAAVAEIRPAFEDMLAALVELPSVSMDPSRAGDIAACAELACDYLRAIGAEAEVIETGGHPLVLGRVIRDPSFPTITVYNHLDVQPADPAEWNTPPFTFSRAPGAKKNDLRWFGRGTTDDKGPALAAYFGAKLALEDDVRCNVQFIWELEEEIGSPNFAKALAKTIDSHDLRTDGVVVSDTIWVASDKPALPYGLRGLMGLTVRLETGAKDVHSGTTGGAARNPVGELAQLISECYDARTGRVKIPGFYDDVRKLTSAERKGLGRAGFARKRFQKAHELHDVRFKDDARLMEAIMAQPTFEVHGLVGGYTGPGIKTIVPHAAEAKLSTRLVPDQRPDKMFKHVKAFIKKRLPDAVVTSEGMLEPYLAEIGGPHHEAAAAAMKATFGKEPGLTREGGSIGAVLTMRRLLRAPIVFMGLSLPEHGYHAINENFDWRQGGGGIEMFYRYFHAIAAQSQKPAAKASVAGKKTRGTIKR